MAENTAPYPSFVKIFYHSEFAPHVMTLPARTWVAPATGHTSGFFEPWVGANIDADTMIMDFINQAALVYDPDVAFDRYEIWTKATPTGIPTLRVVVPIAVTGSAAAVGWNEAVQVTVTTRSLTDNSMLRLVLLDVFTDNFFGKEFDISGSAALQTLVDQLLADANAWQTRKGSQATIIRSATTTLNNRLRREYHLR